MSTPPALVTLNMDQQYLDPDGRPYAVGTDRPVTMHYVIHTSLFALAGCPAAELVKAYALAMALPKTGNVELAPEQIALIRKAVERKDYIAAIVGPTLMAFDNQGPGPVGAIGQIGQPGATA
jgi:hypothetical protein